MTRWYTRQGPSHIEIVLTKRTPLVSQLRATLYTADNHPIALNMTLKYAYHPDEDDKVLDSIRIDDLTGNGDSHPAYRNKGLGSALVSTTLKFIGDHTFELSSTPCSITGQMGAHDDRHFDSIVRRSVFWQKMAMQLHDPSDPMSKFTGQLFDDKRDKFAWNSKWHQDTDDMMAWNQEDETGLKQLLAIKQDCDLSQQASRYINQQEQRVDKLTNIACLALFIGLTLITVPLIWSLKLTALWLLLSTGVALGVSYSLSQIIIGFIEQRYMRQLLRVKQHQQSDEETAFIQSLSDISQRYYHLLPRACERYLRTTITDPELNGKCIPSTLSQSSKMSLQHLVALIRQERETARKTRPNAHYSHPLT